MNFAERNEQANACIGYVSSEVIRDVCEVGVQTDGYKNSDDYDKQSNIDSSSQYCGSSESVSISENESGVNSDPEVCKKSYKGVIIQKDSEIIVLKNKLGVRNNINSTQKLSSRKTRFIYLANFYLSSLSR